MKSHQLLSEKDLQLLKITFRTITQNYYDNPSQQNISSLLLMCRLCTQTISTRQQSDTLLLVSILQILKVKSKSHKQLNQSIQALIVHMKNPLKIYIKNQTIQESLDNVGIYALACNVINRFYEHEMKPRSDSYNWKDIIAKISKGSDKSMVHGLEAIVMVLPDFQNWAKEVSKSGMIKYMCSVYLPQVLEDKICLYRSLKVMKMVSKNDRTVLPGRQKNIALVIYTHPAYILIIQQISQNCYDGEYTIKILSNPRDIDPMYVWSYNTNFCQQSSQRTVDELQKFLVESGKNISVDLEWKIYSIVNNLFKTKDLKINQTWKMPMNAQKNINAFLKLMISVVEKNPQAYKKVDFKTIDYVYDKSKVSDTVTDKLIKDLKALDPAQARKPGRLQPSIFQHFTIDKNPEILMQKAKRIPKSAKDIKVTEQILNISHKNLDELQVDTIRSLKNKSLQSLRESIVQKYPIEIANLFNNLSLDGNDPEIINKLIKLGELALTMDPDCADKFDQKKFLAILQWLENNHGTTIVDWIAASQMLAIIFGPDQWKSHIDQIPQRSFWLLNATNGPQTPKFLSKLSSLPPNHKKIPIILGILSKTGDPQIKKALLKHPILQNTISQICSYKNASRSSTKTYRPDQDISDGQKMKKYLINVLNLSYYIYNWNEGTCAKQIEGKIIRPCLQNVIKSFQGYEHQYRFVENCLPYKINVNDLKDINLAKLLQTHGRLSSYLYKNKYDGRIDFSKISTIALETDPQKIDQILKFLQENPDKIECQDLLALLDLMLRNAKKEHKYWKFYPNYMSILSHIAGIATKTNNPQLIQKITEIYERLINGTADNDQITEQQFNELYEKLCEGLQRLIDRKIKIDANTLKREAQKIKDKEWKKKIIDKLKIISQMNVKIQPPPPTRVSLQTQSATMKEAYVGNKYQSPVNISQQPKLQTQVQPPQNKSDIRLQASSIGVKQPMESSRVVPQQKAEDFEQKKDENIFQGQIDTNQIIKDEEQAPQSAEQKQLLDALKILKMIIQKQEPKETFPKLYDIFLASEFNKNRRYILGHLLTEYYEVIERDPRVINLLEMKDKTNLCKEVCYQFLCKFEEVFKIGKRWKLIGFQFLDIAMERTKCRNKNKIPCVENGCQIAEYNLLKSNDMSYFYNKKYHTLVVDLMNKIEDKNEALFYLLLVGTSARFNQVKTYYISNKMHVILTQYANKTEWMQDKRICANLSYALSSLVYTQNHISIEVCSKKPQMLKLLASYQRFATTKSVIQSGCSLLSNICYSNKETKELLYQYKTNQILVEIFSKNLGVPEVSTYKQIMRTLGNISLHKASSEKLILLHVCQMIVTLAEKLNILIFRDDQKLKVLKLIVDFFSNLASHKTNLETIHAEGVTNFVITILETTDISQDQVLMACIDTIDGLCQNQQIQNYVVMDKKMLLQLIDLLKIKQDQKLITKSIRLLTNMTLNQVCIPYILQANLLSVLANIVLPVYHNEKIDTYINKVILRIFARKPDMKLVLKSGYLDCLMKALEINPNVDDGYIDILLHYCQFIPNYLNHRAFFNLVKILTSKQNNKDTIEKCFKVIRVIFTSEEREEDDINIEGSSLMYDKLLQNPHIPKSDVIYLIALHCTKSRKFKKQLLTDHLHKKSNTIQQIHKFVQTDQNKQLTSSAMFTILNKDRKLADIGQEIVKEQDFAYRVLSKGFQCKLFRIDGSSKSAIVDINQMYMIRAYKYPDGEVKKKYVVSVRQLRDWQFVFQADDDAWKNSVFMKEKGMFQAKPVIENCVTLLGSQQWGEFSLINLEFADTQTKIQFCKAISALVLSFKM